MAGSPFYARIKADVVGIVRAIPEGRVTSFAEIGRWLDVAPRHVAYILSRLDGTEADCLPWHRVVADGGVVPASRTKSFALSRRALLEAEGHRIDPDGRLDGFGDVFLPASALPHGIAAQIRPTDAPAPRSGRRPKGKA